MIDIPMSDDQIILNAQLKYASYDYGPQDIWIEEWTDRVLRAHEHNQALRRGQHLYLMLPKEFAVKINSTLHDPFHSNMERGEIIHWFTRHITFNHEGQMVLLRDYEKVLWERQDMGE